MNNYSKEFLCIDGILMVREATRVEASFSPLGKPLGWGTAVVIRPATLAEVQEYRKDVDKRPNEARS